MLRIGCNVKYVDPRGKVVEALVTEIWGKPEDKPAINLVMVNQSEEMKDSFGRQIIRQTSVSHKSVMTAPGNYWMLNTEVPN